MLRNVTRRHAHGSRRQGPAYGRRLGTCLLSKLSEQTTFHIAPSLTPEELDAIVALRRENPIMAMTEAYIDC